MGKILVVADTGDDCCAMPRGLQLATSLDADVDVVAFTYAPLGALKKGAKEEESIRQLIMSERRDEVQAMIEKFRAPDQVVELEVVWEKDIDRWIIKACDAGNYEFVLKTGNRSESLVHTSTDWQLLRECSTPVLLVAKKKWHRAYPVLVALDMTSTLRSKQALNSKLLESGRVLADALDVDMKIITAVEIPTLLADLDLVDPIAFVKQANEEMQPHVEALAQKYGIPCEEFVCKRGPVEKVIASYAAKARAQIVVMGTVARKGVKARLLGNTAEKVLRHMKTDVLAIKP
jgi:universal stress protein E